MKTAKKVFEIIYLVLLALFESYLIILALLGITFEENKWCLAAFIPAAVIALPLSCLIHELGHKLFGVMVKIGTKLKLSFTGSSSCKIIPRTDKNLRARIIFTTVGGLAANLILFVLSLIVFFINAAPLWLASIALPIIPASFFIFAYNVYPRVTGNGKTDGLVICELIKYDDPAKVMIAVLTVQAQILKGKPIEEVDEKLLFGLPVIQEDDQSFIALTELRYEYFKAKGEDGQAQKYKARLEELKKNYLFEYMEAK